MQFLECKQSSPLGDLWTVRSGMRNNYQAEMKMQQISHGAEATNF